MKLIRYTLRKISLVLIPVVIAGGVFIYYAIKFISYGETDEYLVYEMNRITKHVEINGQLPEFHAVGEIVTDSMVSQAVFKDTLIFDSINGEWVPYRDLLFSVQKGDTAVAVNIRHVVLGKGDIAKGSLYIILGLLLLTSLTLLIFLKSITNKIWQPFFVTLESLKAYRVPDEVPVFPSSAIQEFDYLNTTVNQMLSQMSNDYRRTKEFNENAAHELQTNLAIIKTANEELINTLPPDTDWMKKARKSYAASAKLSNIQKSLLLLSMIGNKEFNTTTTVNLKKTVEQTLDEFKEVIEIRGLRLKTIVNDCMMQMDAGLAAVLIENLIKNAVKYNYRNGFIHVELSNTGLVVHNSGKPYSGNPQDLIGRYSKGREGHLGLGLSIVKQICDLYGFHISYSVQGKEHIIKITF